MYLTQLCVAEERSFYGTENMFFIKRNLCPTCVQFGNVIYRISMCSGNSKSYFQPVSNFTHCSIKFDSCVSDFLCLFIALGELLFESHDVQKTIFQWLRVTSSAPTTPTTRRPENNKIGGSTQRSHCTAEVANTNCNRVMETKFWCISI